jgi:2-C-methyl-D-erythritol 4-phosphate cytidylyltransferase
VSVTAAVVIAAGGGGLRMRGVRKQYVELAGEPVLARAIRPFLELGSVRQLVVALPVEDAGAPPAWLRALDPRIVIVGGGESRGASVARGLAAVTEAVDVVLVHDAARPLLTTETVIRVLEAAATGVGAVAAVPVADTIKEVDATGRIVATPPRERLWRAQTPQGAPRQMLMDVYRRAAEEGVEATDDAALLERFGGTVIVVPGAEDNLKVTHAADLVVAEALLRARAAGG